jgi:hypothetical protein
MIVTETVIETAIGSAAADTEIRMKMKMILTEIVIGSAIGSATADNWKRKMRLMFMTVTVSLSIGIDVWMCIKE